MWHVYANGKRAWHGWRNPFARWYNSIRVLEPWGIWAWVIKPLVQGWVPGQRKSLTDSQSGWLCLKLENHFSSWFIKTTLFGVSCWGHWFLCHDFSSWFTKKTLFGVSCWGHYYAIFFSFLEPRVLEPRNYYHWFFLLPYLINCFTN